MMIALRVARILSRSGLWILYLLDGFIIVELAGRLLLFGSHEVKVWIFHIARRKVIDGTLTFTSDHEAYRAFLGVCLFLLVGTLGLLILNKILWKPQWANAGKHGASPDVHVPN